MKERIAEKIDGLIVGRKRDGRNIYSGAGKRALIHACLQPGISVAGSALANGVNANLLRKWIQRYQGRQIGRECFESVVTLNFFLCVQRMLCKRHLSTILN